MAKLIPFYNTTNIANVLDIDDYAYALNFPGKLSTGFTMVIHHNPKYPQYHNLDVDVTAPGNFIVYTEKGWKKISREDIEEQIGREIKECQEYLVADDRKILNLITAKKMMKHVNEYSDTPKKMDIMEKIPKEKRRKQRV